MRIVLLLLLGYCRVILNVGIYLLLTGVHKIISSSSIT